jgi:sarcosine oxidase, subunit gamma
MGDLAERRAPRLASTEWLKALGPVVRFAFYGDARARAAALSVWGGDFSEQSCRAHVHATRAALWLGPDEYLLLDFSGAGANPNTQASLELAMADVPHALVDISHRQLALEISGPNAATILNGACPLDLDLAEFPVGMCTRTVLAKADIVLWRTRPNVFHLEVWRSFADYVTGILSEIAVEFYPAR